MDLFHERCAGLDVHKKMIVACARIAGEGKRVRKEVSRFGTTTAELMRLSEWLTGHEITHVVMEATGVYWKPVWHVLEGSFELMLANAQHVKAVPGRKSDVNDATWLAELLAHGLIRASFVPPQPQQELRDLTRTRKQLMRGRTQQALRIQKLLEDANVKLSSVVSDVLGQASRRILHAIIDGETNADKLVELRGQLKASHEELVAALHGRITEHHRFLLRVHLEQVTGIEKAISELERRIEQQLEPFRKNVEILTTIPGVSKTIAHVLLAEVGTDMSRFQTAGHLVSWAGLCPRMDESAGKKRSTRIRHGDVWLKTDLCQAGLAASRSKKGYLREQFHRIRARRGAKRAIIAVAASILTSAFHMLRAGVAWEDLGSEHFERRDFAKTTRRLTKRLEALGFRVQLTAAA
jgi:transposase